MFKLNNIIFLLLYTCIQYNISSQVNNSSIGLSKEARIFEYNLDSVIYEFIDYKGIEYQHKYDGCNTLNFALENKLTYVSTDTLKGFGLEGCHHHFTTFNMIQEKDTLSFDDTSNQYSYKFTIYDITDSTLILKSLKPIYDYTNRHLEKSDSVTNQVFYFQISLRQPHQLPLETD